MAALQLHSHCYQWRKKEMGLLATVRRVIWLCITWESPSKIHANNGVEVLG